MLQHGIYLIFTILKVDIQHQLTLDFLELPQIYSDSVSYIGDFFRRYIGNIPYMYIIERYIGEIYNKYISK